MPEPKPTVGLEEDICVHIFTVSAAMVGVCLTVIGLIRIVITLDNVNTLADDLLCGDSLLFLASCTLSYGALRTRKTRRMHRLERIADLIFIAAMFLMTAVCLFITYNIATGMPGMQGQGAAGNLQRTSQAAHFGDSASVSIVKQ